MRFSELLTEANVHDAQCTGDAEVKDVQADSRRCRAGSVFVAVRGNAADGHGFIQSAVEAGAVAVVCEDAANVPPGVAHAVVPDARIAAARLAQAIHGWPARKLTCVAVTGTNGKSTVAHLVREILTAAGHSVALLGTISYETGRRTLAASNTTPDGIVLAELMAEMVAEGRTHLVMEASSHALDQHRTDGRGIPRGDLHESHGRPLGLSRDDGAIRGRQVQAVRRAGCGCDSGDQPGRPGGRADGGGFRAPVLWYGLNPTADLWATIERIDSGGTEFTLVAGEDRTPVHTPLIGRHNVYNCLAAAGACWQALGIGLEVVGKALASVKNVPGRLQRVPGGGDFDVFVDYAHTDDALENVLSALRPVTAGRVIVVFGCGGDRDRTKRPRMAGVAERLADRVIITSDNPQDGTAGGNHCGNPRRPEPGRCCQRGNRARSGVCHRLGGGFRAVRRRSFDRRQGSRELPGHRQRADTL